MKNATPENGVSPAGVHVNDPRQSQLKSDEVFDAELASEMVKRTDKLNDTSIELAIRVKQAREFIAWSTAHLRTSWLDWMEGANQSLKDTTMFRMAMERETKTAIATCKDVKQFFCSPEYTDAAAKMKEMVELMERFSKLKESGVMDAFADFILKVSCK
jgi:hypothetical protein